jgi:hypothetical protein
MQATIDKPSVMPQPQPQQLPPEKFFFAVYYKNATPLCR